MNKKELVKAAAKKSGQTLSVTASVLSAVLDTINETLNNDESVVLIGFGVFHIQQRASRKAMNLKTRQPMNVPARKAIRFRPSVMKRSLN